MLAGLLMSGVAYGINVTLFWITFNLFWKRPRTSWKDYIWITYICLIFSLCTIGNGTQFKYGELAFVDYRNHPGGPAGFNDETTPVGTLCNAIYFVNIWFQDGLLLFRYMIICGRKVYVLAFPSFLYLGTLGLGCLMIAIQVSHGASLHSGVIRPILTSYFTLSIAFNILLTCLIVIRLMIARRRYSIVGAGPYVSVSAMLIESAFIYSAAGIAYLVVYGINNRGQNTILPVLAQLQTVAPLLIIMRVAQGRAWSRETGAGLAASSLRFTGHRSQLQTNGGEWPEMGLGPSGATATQIATLDRERSNDTLAYKTDTV